MKPRRAQTKDVEPPFRAPLCSRWLMIFPCVPLCPRGRPWRLLLARVEIRKLLPKVSNFWRVVIDDVWTVGMTCGVVLMVGLGRIKGVQRYQFSHNSTRKGFWLVQMRALRLGNSLLL